MVLRDQVRAEQVWCAHQHLNPSTCTLLIDDVDHIVPHKGDEDLYFRRSNLQGLCKSCHGKKTGRELFRGVCG
jgi:5-methylcytosine-specific restriction endonuclease McrA